MSAMVPWCLKAIGDHVYTRQHRKRLEVLVFLKQLFEVSEGLDLAFGHLRQNASHLEGKAQ